MDFICVKISGLNLSRIIDKLVLKGVLVQNLKVKHGYIKFEILESELYILKQLCKQEHKTFDIVYRNGLKQFIFKGQYVLGFVLAFVVCFCYLFSYSVFIFDVNVVCGSVQDCDLLKVESVLKSNGVYSGMKKKDVDASKIEKFIQTEFDDISKCVVDVDGGSLNICVYPATKESESLPIKIVSKYDAVITSVEVYAGECLIKVGDVVKAGDVLMKCDSGVAGKIEGRVYFSATELYNENQVVEEKTGNVYNIKNYKIFNKYLIKQQNNCTFKNYLAKKCDFYISDKLFLPIICEEFLFYETELKDVVIPYTDVEEVILERAYKKALDNVESKTNKYEVSYSVVKEGSYTRVDCFLECEMSLF